MTNALDQTGPLADSVVTNTPTERARAAVTVADNATGAADCLRLLRMLGLTGGRDV